MTKMDDVELWKSYFYPDTDIFINHYGIKNEEKLREVEATRSFERLLELREKPLDCGFGKEQLKAVHRYIFGDVYPFAGEYRKVNIKKERGSFLHAHDEEDIDLYLDESFQEASEKILYCQGNKLAFCEVLAKLYSEIIYCHPFREGNGRAAREFIREYSIRMSEELGFGSLELDWGKVNFRELNRNIEVNHQFVGNIVMIFYDALTPINQKDNRI